MTLAEIRALCEAASPGPWEAVYPHDILNPTGFVDGSKVAKNHFFIRGWCASTEKIPSDLDFVAAARELMPKLVALAEVAACLEAQIARTVDLSIDWRDTKNSENRAISTVVSGNALHAFVQALAALEAAP